MKADITVLDNGTVRATLYRWLLPNRVFQRTVFEDGSVYWSDINTGETHNAAKVYEVGYNIATRFEILYSLYKNVNRF